MEGGRPTSRDRLPQRRARRRGDGRGLQRGLGLRVWGFLQNMVQHTRI